jgi:hypothetical protein
MPADVRLGFSVSSHTATTATSVSFSQMSTGPLP